MILFQNGLFYYLKQKTFANTFSFPVQFIWAQPLPATADEDHVQREGVDSDHFSGSNSSFLANEKLMSVDSLSSDITGSFFIF